MHVYDYTAGISTYIRYNLLAKKSLLETSPPPTTTATLTKRLSTAYCNINIIIICILPDVRVTRGAARYTRVVVTAAAALTPAIIAAAAHPLEPADTRRIHL